MCCLFLCLSFSVTSRTRHKISHILVRACLWPYYHLFIFFFALKKIQGGFSSWVLNEYHLKIQSQAVDKPTLQLSSMWCQKLHIAHLCWDQGYLKNCFSIFQAPHSLISDWDILSLGSNSGEDLVDAKTRSGLFPGKLQLQRILCNSLPREAWLLLLLVMFFHWSVKTVLFWKATMPLGTHI